MLKIFATFAFGMVGASAAPAIDTSPPAVDSSPAIVVSNRSDEAPARNIKANRSDGMSKVTAAKQSRSRQASESAADGGFCESPDERARAHCLIYMKLREERS